MHSKNRANKIKIIAVLLASILLSFSFYSCASEPEVPIVPDPVDETLQIPEGHIYYKVKDGIRSFLPNPLAKQHPYNLEKFTKKGQQIFYRDDEYESLLGVDVSRHNGKIRWKKLKKAGYQFAFIRIGWRGYETGILHVDEKFHKNIKGALKAGFDVGVYIFSQAINEKEALEEAELVIEELKGYKITLPVVFDPEHIYPGPARTDKISGEQFTKNTVLFLEKMKEAGYDAMIYSNLQWQGFVLDIMKLQDYKMWYADYVSLPRTTYDFAFWQYTSSGNIPGSRHECDLNLWIRKKPSSNKTFVNSDAIIPPEDAHKITEENIYPPDNDDDDDDDNDEDDDITEPRPTYPDDADIAEETLAIEEPVEKPTEDPIGKE